jgi:hypothetical protein
VRWSARPRQWFSRKDTRTVALDQSALLDVLDALKAADGDDRIRQAAQTIYQALIEAELTSVIGAGPTSAPRPGWPRATAIGPGCWRPLPGIWSCASPSCGPGRSSLACWSARRMAGQRPPLPLRRLHGPAHPGTKGGGASPAHAGIDSQTLIPHGGATSTTPRGCAQTVGGDAYRIQRQARRRQPV